MKSINILSVAIAASLLFFLSNCTHDPILPELYSSNDPIIVGDGLCSPDTMYYNRDIAPILLSNCATSGCHNAASAKDGVDLSSYARVLATGGIKPFNAANSELIEVLFENGEDQMPPPPSNHLPNDLIAKLEKWINQGAFNLECNDTTTCDTVNITYSQHVSSILSTSCVGCHSGSTPQGGIDLSNYANVKTQVDNGKLMGSIQAQPGFVAMPPGGTTIGNCKITQISIWVNEGAKNN